MINKSKYIIASAGTGKTEALVSHIENLIINERIDIMNIALITYTNKATQEMIDRLRRKLYANLDKGEWVKDQLDKLNMASISTIHSFCNDIIKEYGMMIGISPTYKIGVLNNEFDKILDQVVKENYNKEIQNYISLYEMKKILKNFYEDSKNKGYKNTFKYVENEKTFWDKFRNYIYDVYNELDRKVCDFKIHNNLLTNNDLIHYAAELIENDQVLNQLANKYKYIFVDECQDINFEQMNMLKRFLTRTSLIIVGDERQSIYAFRGSDAKAFRLLLEEMEKEKALKLNSNINYRSSDKLIKVLNKLFNSKFYYQNTKLNFVNNELKDCGRKSIIENVFEFEYEKNIEEIMKFLTLNIEKGQNESYTKIVVLCRTNSEVNQVLTRLKAEGINAKVYSSKSLYRSQSIIDFLKIAKFLMYGDIYKKELFYTDYYLSCKNFRPEDETYWEGVLKGLKIEIRQETLSFVLNRLIELTNINNYYLKIGKEQYIANLQRLKEILRSLSEEGKSTIESIEYLEEMIVNMQNEQEPETINKTDVVVSTIHAFKGLTAEIVILYNADRGLIREQQELYVYDYEQNSIYFNKDMLTLNNTALEEDENFKNQNTIRNIEYLEEELRLMYVACTRPREKLIIHNTNSKKMLKYIEDNHKNYISYSRWIRESNVKKLF